MRSSFSQLKTCFYFSFVLLTFRRSFQSIHLDIGRLAELLKSFPMLVMKQMRIEHDSFNLELTFDPLDISFSQCICFLYFIILDCFNMTPMASEIMNYYDFFMRNFFCSRCLNDCSIDHCLCIVNFQDLIFSFPSVFLP